MWVYNKYTHTPTHITLHSEPFSMAYLQRVRCRHLNKCEKLHFSSSCTNRMPKQTHTHTHTQPDEPHVHDWRGGLEKGLYVGGLDSPCACVHFSRKTMNTKRKSISQFFTVFRLEIKWLKKRCKSIYLLSTRTHTHTHTHSGHSQYSYSYSYSYLIASFVPALQCAQQQFAQHITHTHTQM